MVFRKSKTEFNPSTIKIIIGNSEIRIVDKFKYLGVILDETLSFESHYKHVVSKISYTIGIIEYLKRLLTQEAFVLLLNSYVLSNFDYCLTSWAYASKCKLDFLQHKVDRLLMSYFYPRFTNKSKHYNLSSYNYDTNTLNKLYDRCNIFSIHERLEFYTIKQTYQIVHHNAAPDYLRSILKVKQRTRASKYDGMLEKISLRTTFAKNSFIDNAVNYWNTMIQSKLVKISNKSYEFYKNLSQYVIRSRYYNNPFVYY